MFYVYELSYADNGEVFYVGAGSGDRWQRHRWFTENSYPSPIAKHVLAMRKEGRAILSRKVFESTDKKKVYAEEVRRIAWYGLRNLVNIALGGLGAAGVPVSEEERRRRSVRAKKQRAREIRNKPRTK